MIRCKISICNKRKKKRATTFGVIEMEASFRVRLGTTWREYLNFRINLWPPISAVDLSGIIFIGLTIIVYTRYTCMKLASHFLNPEYFVLVLRCFKLIMNYLERFEEQSPKSKVLISCHFPKLEYLRIVLDCSNWFEHCSKVLFQHHI